MDSNVDRGIPSLAAAPSGPETRPWLAASAASTRALSCAIRSSSRGGLGVRSRDRPRSRVVAVRPSLRSGRYGLWCRRELATVGKMSGQMRGSIAVPRGSRTNPKNLAERVGFVPRTMSGTRIVRRLNPALTPRPSEARDSRRGWDSNPTGPFRFCKLQILKYHRCCKCQECRRALPAIARRPVAWFKLPILHPDAGQYRRVNDECA